MEYAYTKRGKKVTDCYWNESGVTFGLSARQIANALDELDEWKDRQADNFDNKTVDYVNYCHANIVKITEWLKRNGYK